jgi:sugar phosphate isomerase/epimerase
MAIRIGVSSHLFRGRPTAVAAAFQWHGLSCTQLTPSFPGLRFDEPGQILPARCRQAAEPFEAAGIPILCLSGHTHLMDPDLDRRHRGIVRLHALIRGCRDFGTDRIVTETGSLNPASPLLPYPPNRGREAWTELRLIVAEALQVAEAAGVVLLLKPGAMHVLADVEDAVRLREELPHPNLGFVMDPAVLLIEHDPAAWPADLERIFDQLGSLSPVLHAKDLAFYDGRATTPRVGRGRLNYTRILELFRCYQPQGAVILEHLRPDEVAEAKRYLERMALP